MLLSKVTSKIGLAEASQGFKSIVLLKVTSMDSQRRRHFSIEEIGKRYDKPWDYAKKRYGLYGQMFDSTMRKLGENSIIITVEGNFGSGKTEFAKQLAKNIDFVYAREPDIDYHKYVDANGENWREVTNKIVGDNQLYHIDSLEDWHLKPTFKGTIQLQHTFYNIRFLQTRQALLHLFSTGQGVVLERSAFSDKVIGQSLYENFLMSDEAYKFYMRDLIPNTLSELWRPHVSIYLDKTPEECLKTIKEKGKPYEKQSKVYTLELLKTIEKNYKKNFLPEIRSNLHVLTYNSNEAHPDKVVEDLELLDFEDQNKFSDWRIRRETIINTYRKYISDIEHITNVLAVPNSYTNVPEYLLYGEELVKLDEKIEQIKAAKKTKLTPFSPIGYAVEERNYF